MKKAKNTGDVSITGSPGAVVNVGAVSEISGSAPTSGGTAGVSEGTPDPSEPASKQGIQWDWKWLIGLLVAIAIGVTQIIYSGSDSTPDVNQTITVEGNENDVQQTAPAQEDGSDSSQTVKLEGDVNAVDQRVTGEGDSQ